MREGGKMKEGERNGEERTEMNKVNEYDHTHSITSEWKFNNALSRVHTPTVYFIIDLTSECVIISEYNHLTDYHHYGNHGALPTCTIIMGLWVQFQ